MLTTLTRMACHLYRNQQSMVSARNGHDKIVKLSIDNKAYVNNCDKDGDSPLYVSVKKWS
ncbi:hypothetical protein KUTeg_004641 [Tegillarca granosa]|uniref:Uncharacterized protein n=1 Tax=Tegillarca granosa TaxID=220873 RepID=A0ABQ9FKL7_TEGGR|nr:hypothetical protein KUTeg_004641 [Tegillarca granosa]